MSRCSFRLLDQVEDAHADGDIQHRDRLIRQDDLRIDRQGASHRHPLALAAGQLMGVLAGELLGRVEPDGRQQAKDALLDAPRLLVDPDRALEVKADRAGGIERSIRILEDHLDRPPVLQRGPTRLVFQYVSTPQEDLAARRLDQARDQSGRRGLAAARLTHKRHHLAPTDGERCVGQGMHMLGPRCLSDRELLGEVTDLEDHAFIQRLCCLFGIGRGLGHQYLAIPVLRPGPRPGPATACLREQPPSGPAAPR